VLTRVGDGRWRPKSTVGGARGGRQLGFKGQRHSRGPTVGETGGTRSDRPPMAPGGTRLARRSTEAANRVSGRQRRSATAARTVEAC
jgi:hypothetical protein